jgi:hypothetical protein
MKSHFALALAFAAFVPVAALAQSQDEQQACMNDAFTVCGNAIPDRDRVAACLAQNINRISAPCRAVMARYSRPGTSSSARRERAIDQDRYDRGGDQFDRPDRSDRWDQYDQRGGRYGRY